MRRREFLGLAAGALAVGGCATVADARAERGKGIIVSYAAPFKDVWLALLEIMKEQNLRLAADNMSEGYMLAEYSASAFSWGERVAVFVERIGTQGNSRVEVVSKRVLGVNITAADWEPRIHGLLGQRFRRL